MRKGEFPAARDVLGRPMWVESEINRWIEDLPKRVYQPLEQDAEKKTKRVETRQAKLKGDADASQAD
jgi:hypothetical protein